MAFDPPASETTPEEVAHAGPEEGGLESAFCRVSRNHGKAYDLLIGEATVAVRWRPPDA